MNKVEGRRTRRPHPDPPRTQGGNEKHPPACEGTTGGDGDKRFRAAWRRLLIGWLTALIVALSALTGEAQTVVSANPSAIADKADVPLALIPPDYPWVSPTIRASAYTESLYALVQRSLTRYGAYLQLDTIPEFRVVDVRDWATYVNYHHFVPLTAEGTPEGHGYNFNYYEDEEPKSLPVAEITETGAFVLWKQVLAYYGVPSPYDQDFIDSIVSHELRHFRQWRALAVEAMREVGQVRGNLPRTSRDLSTKAFARFMEKWGDVAHYQGRELEVYTSQVREGELPALTLQAPHVRQYYEGVKGSRWQDDFGDAIRYMEGETTPQEAVP